MASPSPVPSVEVVARQNRSGREGLLLVVEAGAFVGDVQLVLVGAGCDRHGDRGAGGRGVERVVEEVVEDLLDGAGHGLDDDWRVESAGSELDVAGLDDGGPGVDAIGAEAGEVDGVAWRSIVGAGQLEEVVDEGAQAVGLLHRGVELGLGVRGEAAVEVLEAQLQRGQR